MLTRLRWAPSGVEWGGVGCFTQSPVLEKGAAASLYPIRNVWSWEAYKASREGPLRSQTNRLFFSGSQGGAVNMLTQSQKATTITSQAC